MSFRNFPARRGPRVQGYKRTELDGYSFQSKLEAALYQHLKILEKAGEVEIQQTQDHVHLSDARIVYIADFRVLEKNTGEQVWYEAKGFENERWPIIKKLWKVYGPGKLRIFKGTYTKLKEAEVIIPERGLKDDRS